MSFKAVTRCLFCGRLFLDIDGTILDEVTPIRDRTCHSVAEAGKRGHMVCIATGNAGEALKVLVRKVTGNVHKDGVYQVFVMHGLCLVCPQNGKM